MDPPSRINLSLELTLGELFLNKGEAFGSLVGSNTEIFCLCFLKTEEEWGQESQENTAEQLSGRGVGVRTWPCSSRAICSMLFNHFESLSHPL